MISEPTTKSPANILVVDDTLSNLRLLVQLLKNRGYRARAMPDGELALQAVQSKPPDLILLDINMPGMNGYEVCARLKAEPAWAEIPVIFISALYETFDKVKAFGVGGVDYITKPFQFEEVEARVATHLELRRQKRELQESHERLLNLERLRDNLVHMIVHDMRSPLNVTLIGLELLSESPVAQDKNNAKLLKMCRTGADTMRKMVTQMLDIHRLEAGEMPLYKSECDLAKTAEDAINSFGLLARGRRVSFAAPKPVSALYDIDIIRRVIENLLGNAIKFTPENGEVRLAIASDDKNARVTVTDNGPGIPPELHRKIFEKFGQAEGENKRLGVGLGLSFCKLAIEAHGGHTGVESEVGQGSAFWFELPRGGPDEPQEKHAG